MSPSWSMSATVTILDPLEDQEIGFLMENVGSPEQVSDDVSRNESCRAISTVFFLPVVSSLPRFLYQLTALSLLDALTRSIRPSESKSAATAHRAPIAWFVTTVRTSVVRRLAAASTRADTKGEVDSRAVRAGPVSPSCAIGSTKLPTSAASFAAPPAAEVTSTSSKSRVLSASIF